MSRSYTELECGCLVSCDGGGGLMPTCNCDDDPAKGCKFQEYIKKHKFCKVCGECIICYDHSDCKEKK